MSALTLDTAYVVWSISGEYWLPPAGGIRAESRELEIAGVFTDAESNAIVAASAGEIGGLPYSRYQRCTVRESIQEWGALSCEGTVIALLRAITPTAETTL